MARGPVITAYSMCNGLGATTAAVLDRLSSSQHGLSPCPLDVPFKTVCGVVQDVLSAPPSSLAAYDSRTVRLALRAYGELAPRVSAAVKRWGSSRVGLLLGTSTGGVGETERAYFAWRNTGTLPNDYHYRTQHPFDAVAQVLKACAEIEGPAYVVSTACSSSAKVLASAARLIASGVVDAVLTGGVDSLTYTTVRGFHSLGVMAEGPCRPFHRQHPGMNVGEGAALLLLEREGEGPGRLLGVGETSDAFHMSAPDPEGKGAVAAMVAALSDAGLDATQIDHVNAHGTGTVRNDAAEAVAIGAVFGKRVPVASTKGYTGHLLGAAGATEAAFSIACIERQWMPCSLGADANDPLMPIALLGNGQPAAVRHVLSNAFAFGGNNISVVLGAAS